MRARQLLDAKLEFIKPHQYQRSRLGCRNTRSRCPIPPTARPLRRPKAPRDCRLTWPSLYEVPLLDREQEMHLFRKMNYLKYRASDVRSKIDPSRARTSDLDLIERLPEEAARPSRNQLIRSNLRLVVSIAKRHVGPSETTSSSWSRTAAYVMIRAVEKFDFSRGNKFSTYASWAIMKAFAPDHSRGELPARRFVTGHEEMFEAAADNPGPTSTSMKARSNECRRRSRGCSADSMDRSGRSSSAASGAERPASRRWNSSARARYHQGTRTPDRIPQLEEKLRRIAERGKARFANAPHWRRRAFRSSTQAALSRGLRHD